MAGSMGAMVGRGFVMVSPSMRGFRRAVSSEMSGAGSEGAKRFGAGFGAAGRDTGSKAGRGFKDAFKSGSANVADSLVKELQRDVASASKSLATARLRQQDAAGRVRVAEARYAEAVKRSGVESASAVAAGERLASARRREQSANDAVTAASQRLSAAQKNVKAATDTASAGGGLLQGRLGGAFARVADSARNAGAAIRDHIGKGIDAASQVAAAGVIGLSAAIGGGFGRLTSLDEALARMKGLGFASADIEKAMNIANDAAMGTSFAMNDMANAAAMAMTNGIKPGEEMVSYLDAIKGAATASGAPLSELSSIFGKLTQNTTAGMAVTAELTQLADRQIPIWQSLSKTMGLPLDEVRKLASEGAISLQDIETAVLDATGGMAKAMGETLPAKIKNTGSAFSRLGMALLGTRMEGDGLVGGLYEPLKSFFDMLRNGIDAVTAVISPFMQRVTDAFGGKAGELFTSLAEKFGAFTAKVKEGGLDSLSGQASGLVSVLGPLTGGLLALGAGGLGPLLSKLPVVGGLLGGLGGKLAFLASPLGIAGAALAGFLATGADVDGLVNGITGMVDAVVAALPGLIDSLVAAIPAMVNGLVSGLSAFLEAGAQIIDAIVAGLVEALPLLIEGAVELLNGLVTGLVENLPTLIDAALQMATSLLNGLLQALPLLVQGAITLITGLVQGLVQNLPLIIRAAIQLMQGLMDGLVQALPLLIDAALQIIAALVQGITDNLALIIQAALQLVMSLVAGLIENLPALIEATLQLMFGIVDALMQNLPALIDAGIRLTFAIAKGLVDAFPELVGQLPELIGRIVDAFMGMDWLGLGADIIGGIVQGIGNMAGAFIDAIIGLAQDAWDSIIGFFGIASPSRLMRDTVGKQLPAGLAVGVEAGTGKAVAAARRMSQATADAAQTTATGVHVATGQVRAGGASPVSVHQEIHAAPGMSEYTVGEIAVGRLEKFLGGVS